MGARGAASSFTVTPHLSSQHRVRAARRRRVVHAPPRGGRAGDLAAVLAGTLADGLGERFHEPGTGALGARRLKGADEVTVGVNAGRSRRGVNDTAYSAAWPIENFRPSRTRPAPRARVAARPALRAAMPARSLLRGGAESSSGAAASSAAGGGSAAAPASAPAGAARRRGRHLGDGRGDGGGGRRDGARRPRPRREGGGGGGGGGGARRGGARASRQAQCARPPARRGGGGGANIGLGRRARLSRSAAGACRLPDTAHIRRESGDGADQDEGKLVLEDGVEHLLEFGGESLRRLTLSVSRSPSVSSTYRGWRQLGQQSSITQPLTPLELAPPARQTRSGGRRRRGRRRRRHEGGGARLEESGTCRHQAR